jgi:hypothetical protein
VLEGKLGSNGDPSKIAQIPAQNSQQLQLWDELLPLKL